MESSPGAGLDPKTVWSAIEAANGSVRLAACALRVSVGSVLAAIADDPNAVITARRATVAKIDSGPLPIFRLWVDDDEDESARQP